MHSDVPVSTAGLVSRGAGWAAGVTGTFLLSPRLLPAGPGHQPSHYHDLLAEEMAWPGVGPELGTQGKSGWCPSPRAEDRPPGPDRPAAPHPLRLHGTAALVL